MFTIWWQIYKQHDNSFIAINSIQNQLFTQNKPHIHLDSVFKQYGQKEATRSWDIKITKGITGPLNKQEKK